MSISARKQFISAEDELKNAKNILDELENKYANGLELEKQKAATQHDLDDAYEQLKKLAFDNYPDLERSLEAAKTQISNIDSHISKHLEQKIFVKSKEEQETWKRVDITLKQEREGWKRELDDVTKKMELKKLNEDLREKLSKEIQDYNAELNRIASSHGKIAEQYLKNIHEEIALQQKIVDEWDAVIKQQEKDRASQALSIIKLDRYVGGFKDSRSVLYYMLSTFAFLFDVVSGLVSNILKPIKYITTGVTGLWDSYMAYRDKTMDENRKYFMSTMLGGLIDIAVALTMFAAAVATIAAPVIVIPVMLSVSLVMGLVNASAATDIYRKKVKKAKADVAQVENELKEAVGKAPDVIADLKIKLYNAQQVLVQARNDRFQAKRTLGLSVFSSIFGILGILALAAVFSNPFTAAALAIATTVGFAVMAVVDVVDKRNNNKFTRAISRLGSRIKKWWRGDSEADKKPHVDLKEKVEQRQLISVVDVPDLKHSSSEQITLKIAGGDRQEAEREAKNTIDSLHASQNVAASPKTEVSDSLKTALLNTSSSKDVKNDDKSDVPHHKHVN